MEGEYHQNCPIKRTNWGADSEPKGPWDRPRRPVRRKPLGILEDVQGALPMGWCCSCGKEVYTWPAQELCARCEKEEANGKE